MKKSSLKKLIPNKIIWVIPIVLWILIGLSLAYYFLVVVKNKQIVVKPTSTVTAVATPLVPTSASDRALKVAAYIYTHASQTQINDWVKFDPVTMPGTGTMQVWSISQKKFVYVPNRVPAIVLANGITTSPKTSEEIVTVIGAYLDNNPATLALDEAKIEKGNTQTQTTNQSQNNYDAAVSAFSKHVDDLIQQQQQREYIDIKFDQLNP